jgi:hypothetical protein
LVTVREYCVDIVNTPVREDGERSPAGQQQSVVSNGRCPPALTPPGIGLNQVVRNALSGEGLRPGDGETVLPDRLTERRVR